MRGDGRGSSEVLLGSGSPRRRMLLQSAGFGVLVARPQVDESPRSGEAPAAYVQRLARRKHAVVAEAHAAQRAPVVAADTVVSHEGALLGKPSDRVEAEQMLRALSGRWHAVLTGVAVGRAGREPVVLLAETRVRFKPLRAEEIAWYLATEEWCDKAGGYGIQGRGAFLVAALQGSYTNVVGLPLAETVEALADLGCLPSVEWASPDTGAAASTAVHSAPRG